MKEDQDKDMKRKITASKSLEELAVLLQGYLLNGKTYLKKVGIPNTLNLKLIIHPKEKHHNLAHFHIKDGPGIEATFAINNLDKLSGKVLGSNLMNRLKEFYFELGGKQKFIEIWNLTRPSDDPIGQLDKNGNPS